MAKAVVARPKLVMWVGSSREDLRAFPELVQKGVGFALWFAQIGDKHPHAKPLRGFGGGGVLEIIEDSDGNTYRVVYTVTFADLVYVLQCFQKKSKRGAKTPKPDVDLIKARLRVAEADFKRRKEAN